MEDEEKRERERKSPEDEEKRERKRKERERKSLEREKIGKRVKKRNKKWGGGLFLIYILKLIYIINKRDVGR